eukprot:COSAG06_NODE_1790_length_8394_cov_34.639301_12_plen_266_part_00
MHIDVALARICVAASLLPGLAAQTTLPPGESRHEVSFGDRSSTVIVHVPAGLDAPVPLVLGLHGWFGSGAGFCASTRMGEHVDAMGFIGVCATGDGSSGENSWNAAGCCGSAVTQDVDDVGFLRAVVGWVDERAELTEEPSRVPRSDSGQKMILWAFYRQGSNFEALVQPLRASARARDRPGHTILIKYLCPTEPGSAATSPVLRCLAPKNHYTAEFKLQATTRPFCLPRPFRPYPAPRTGRGTQLNSQETLPRKEKGQNWLVFE